MKKFLVIFFIMLLSCNHESKEEYFSNGNLKKTYTLIDGAKHGIETHYYKSGNVKKIINYNKGIIKDTIKEFYDSNNSKIKSIKLESGTFLQFYNNGQIFSKGKLKNDKRKGDWEFYTKNGDLSEIREYKIIQGKSYLNQNRYFNPESKYWTYLKDSDFNRYDDEEYKSDTLKYNYSNYAEFDLGKDTISINEPWRAVCFYYTPVFRDKSSNGIIVLPKKGYSFNKDFSNIKTIPKDTFRSLSIDKINRKYFPDDDPKYTIAFGKYFRSSGDKVIRGYFSEFYVDSLNRTREVRKFFDKNVYVNKDENLISKSM